MWLLTPVEPEKLPRRGLQMSYIGKRVKGYKCASKHIREGILNRETACVKIWRSARVDRPRRIM